MPAPAPPRAVVVVPAHDEQAVVGRCLTTLLTGAAPGQLAVVVVSNGSTDATVERARAAALGLPGTVTVLEIPQASKTAALRAGDAHADAHHPDLPRIYLDADVALDATTALALAGTLEAAGDVPRVAAPAMRVETLSSGPLVRAWYRAWTALPYVRTGLVGSGVFAVNAAGRERLGPMPDVTNDDGWVRRGFAPQERLTTPGEFVVQAPRSVTALVRRRARIALGNSALAADLGADAGGNGLGALARLVRSRTVTPQDAAAYAGVTLAARLLARWRRLRGTTGTWSADTTTRTEVPL